MTAAEALIPLVVLAAAYVAACLVDVATAEEVRHLERWAWMVICVLSIPMGGIIYLVFGRVHGKHDFRRGYQAANSALSRLAGTDWPGQGGRPGPDNPPGSDFDLARWAAAQQAALQALAAGPGPFRLPDWFAPVADDLGSLVDPIGFGRWSFTPTRPFVRGYQQALRDAWAARQPAA